MDEKNQPPVFKKSLRGIIFLEITCFVVWIIGIFFFYLPLPKSSLVVARLADEPSPYDALGILLSVIIVLVLFYRLRRSQALAPVVAVLFGVIIYNTLSVFVEPLVALTVAAFIIYIERAYRSFVSNNLLVILGVFAAAVSFVGTYSVNFLLILLRLFSLYDLVGVFWTKAIPKVAQGAAKIGMPLLILMPKKEASWWQVPTPDTIVSMMGAGDLFIPLLFLSAVSAQVGWQVALISFVGAVAGSGLNILFAKRVKGGIPAIPILAVGLVVGYFVGVLVI